MMVMTEDGVRGVLDYQSENMRYKTLAHSAYRDAVIAGAKVLRKCKRGKIQLKRPDAYSANWNNPLLDHRKDEPRTIVLKPLHLSPLPALVSDDIRQAFRKVLADPADGRRILDRASEDRRFEPAASERARDLEQSRIYDEYVSEESSSSERSFAEQPRHVDFYDVTPSVTQDGVERARRDVKWANMKRAEEVRVESELLRSKIEADKVLEEARLEKSRRQARDLELMREAKRLEEQRVANEILEQKRQEAVQLERERLENEREENRQRELRRAREKQLTQKQEQERRLEAQRMDEERLKQERIAQEERRREIRRRDQCKLEAESLENSIREEKRLEALREQERLLKEKRDREDLLEQRRIETARAELQRLESQRMDESLRREEQIMEKIHSASCSPVKQQSQSQPEIDQMKILDMMKDLESRLETLHDQEQPIRLSVPVKSHSQSSIHLSTLMTNNNNFGRSTANYDPRLLGRSRSIRTLAPMNAPLMTSKFNNRTTTSLYTHATPTSNGRPPSLEEALSTVKSLLRR